ncbi:MAG: AmmeMemoRadiSam system protein B [Thermodesulfobacteriota bacterium]|nr:AmmeMemoRadiSam system protein B [Thermodesulfobacteriota bacterium]
MGHAYQKLIQTVLKTLFFAFVGMMCTGLIAFAELREPVAAGRFYPGEPARLKKTIEDLTRKARKTKVDLPDTERLRALIMPHAGYPYSGYTAAHASLTLSDQEFEKIVILGPDHHAGFNGCAISTVDAYRTPLGEIPLHKDSAALKDSSPLFKNTAAVSKAREHSIEVILPFLQAWDKQFSLIPLVTGNVDPDKLAEHVAPLLSGQTLLIASSDLSHYLPYQQAVERDRETIDMILNLSPEKLLNSSNRACGKVPVSVLIRLAQRYNWEPVCLHYTNSGDTAGTRDNVVGYTTIAFYGGLNMTMKLAKNQGNALVALARKTIYERLGMDAPEPGIDMDNEKALQEKRGTFVTLNLNGELRGCIGSLTADEAIVTGVRRNAINAAFHDPRFPPLTKEEAKKIDVEVSILTDPQPLEFKDSKELLEKLCPEIDGVIIKKGLARATFLPQVWEQLPTREEFLSQLCIKAGLAPNAWEQPGLEVLTYQVQYFESHD